MTPGQGFRPLAKVVPRATRKVPRASVSLTHRVTASRTVSAPASFFKHSSAPARNTTHARASLTLPVPVKVTRAASIVRTTVACVRSSAAVNFTESKIIKLGGQICF